MSSVVVAENPAPDFPVVVAVEVALDSVILLLFDFAAFAVLADLDSVVVVATTLVMGVYALLPSLPAEPDVISTSII